ncbi:MAG: hypothetical protein ISEC1_P1166 [Thiomicrorhabdus sp.]|nr:MAG: hypothetical protein ISEC1_P1166 [Thiomicrorhabdus sp.]
MKQTSLSIGLVIATLVATPVLAENKFLDRTESIAKVNTMALCVDYSELKTDVERKAYIKELDLRSQLSVKDHDLIDKHQVENSMTMCGMYMSRGKPISEQSRQIRPFTFKTVHVYSDMYYVSQSGMIVETLERKEGAMPPSLVVELPKVQAPPVAPK